MFFLLAFLIAGGSYYALERIAPGLLIALVVGVFIVTPLMWFSAGTGIDGFIISSWQWLSGVGDPNGVFGECLAGQSRNAWVLFVFILTILNAAPGVIAVFGIPISVLVVAAGVIQYVAAHKNDWFEMGLWGLTVSLGALILAGVIMRVIHYMSINTACS